MTVAAGQAGQLDRGRREDSSTGVSVSLQIAIAGALGEPFELQPPHLPAVLNWGRFCPGQGTLGNVWGYFWLSQLGDSAGTQGVSSRDAAKHLTMPRTAPRHRVTQPQCQRGHRR